MSLKFKSRSDLFKSWRILGLLAVFFSLLAHSSLFAQTVNAPLSSDNFPYAYYVPQNYGFSWYAWNRPMKTIAFGNGTFVAIGFNATILTSKDGINWANHSSDISLVSSNYANIDFSTEIYSVGGDMAAILYVNQLSSNEYVGNKSISVDEYYRGLSQWNFISIVYGRGTFVILGLFGHALTSRDGEHWVACDLQKVPGLTTRLCGLTAGDSGFVAVGQNGLIFTSPDGLKWTLRDSGTSETISSVAYGNGTYVATKGSSLLISKDGIKWTSADTELGGLNSVVFGNGVFLGMEIHRDFPQIIQAPSPQTARYAAGRTLVSTNGINWSKASDPFPAEGTGLFNAYFPADLSFAGGRFIAMAFGKIATSTNGNTWSLSTDLKSAYNGAAYGNQTFVSVGFGAAIKGSNTVSASSMTIVYSKDAINWKASQIPPSRLIWGSFVNDKVFRVGNDNAFLNILARGYDGNVETTNEYHFLESSDGTTWTTSDQTSIYGIVGGTSLIHYTDKLPVVLASEDGIHWKRIKPTYSDNPIPVSSSAMASNPNTTLSEKGFFIDLNGQAYKLNLNSIDGQVMEIQASSDLQNWETITTITNTGTTVHFVDPDAKNYPQRFYRLKL